MIIISILLVMLFVMAVVVILPEFLLPRFYVLLYHHISADNEQENLDLLYTVKESAFEEQMEILSESSFDIWGLEEIQTYFQGRLKLNRSAVAVTFDDGYQSLLTNGAPILKRYRIPAILFASPYPYWEKSEFRDKMLTPEELGKLAKQGVEIQSHTLDHRPLSGLSDFQVFAEFCSSKKELQAITGQEVISLAPPGNYYRRRFDDLLIRAGYTLCFSADKGSNGVFDRDPMHIRRLIVEKTTDKKAFLRLLTPIGAARARLLGTLKKLPLAFFTPQQWINIRKKIFAIPGIRPLLTTKGLTILGAVILLLIIAAIILGEILV